MGQDTSKIDITEEDFLQCVDKEMVKVEKFTLQKVTELREKIKHTEDVLRANTASNGDFTGDTVAVMKSADEIANDFLRLELYVNLNFMGFHKILKVSVRNSIVFLLFY